MRVIVDEKFDRCEKADSQIILRDLHRINRWLGGHHATRQAFRRLRPPAHFTVLDVGAASSGINLALHGAWPGAEIISLDILQDHLEFSAGARVVADAFRLPFRLRSVDYVYSSLFLHHFSDQEIVRLLTGFAHVARRGVVMVDLERNILARQFLPATRWLFGWHPITVHDAKLSVNAGFAPAELHDYATRAGLAGAQVSRHAPWFRLSITWGR